MAKQKSVNSQVKHLLSRRNAILLLCYCFFSIKHVIASEQKERYYLQLPSGQANITLKSLARKTQHAILFQTNAVSEIDTSAISGYYSLEQALTALLNNTTLSANITNKGVITISLLAPTVASSPETISAKINETISTQAANNSVEVDTTTDVNPVEIITVTANRRSTSIQQTAVTMEAFSGEELAAKGYRNIGQFIDTVPGVTASAEGPGRNRVIIRNISTSTQESGSPFVASYFDDFALVGTDFASDIRLIDMQRVEVLKGPQGTLYGRSAMGGIIRYISNKAHSDAVEGGVSLYASNVNDGGNNYGADGYVNLPLSDNLAVRLVGYNYQNAGFIDNTELNISDFNAEKTTGGRMAVHWQVDDLSSLDVTLFQQNRTGAPNWVTTTRDPGDLNVAGDEGDDIAFDITARTQIAGVIMEESVDLSFVNMKLTKQFTDFSATLLATKSLTELDFVFDQREYVELRSGCACDALEPGDKTTMLDNDLVELRLLSSSQKNFDWILGAYYEKSFVDASNRMTYRGPEQLTEDQIALVDGELLSLNSSEQQYQESALYGELGIDLSEKSHLTFGARHSQIAFNTLSTQADGIVSDINGTKQLVGVKFNSDESVNTYKVAFQHQLSKNMFTFISASSGYRRGGFNLPTINSSFSTFDSDNLWNYEAGIKSTWLSNTLVANASVYLINYDNIQLVIQDPETFVRATKNVGQAQIRGIELSLAYQVNDYLDLNLTGALSDPKLQKDVPGGDSGKKGDGLPGSAKTNFSISAHWFNELANGWDIFSYASYKYIGARLNDFNTDLDVKLPAYQLTDIRLGLRNDDKGYSIALYADNVFDQAAIYIIDRQGSTFESVPTNRPRTLGINFSYNF